VGLRATLATARHGATDDGGDLDGGKEARVSLEDLGIFLSQQQIPRSPKLILVATVETSSVLDCSPNGKQSSG
jgi:hypothetical protein